MKVYKVWCVLNDKGNKLKTPEGLIPESKSSSKLSKLDIRVQLTCRKVPVNINLNKLNKKQLVYLLDTLPYSTGNKR